MDQLLWYLLAGTRGGLNRLRIIQALLERPLNAHQLAERLGLDYRTVRHHLDLLTKNNVLSRPTGDAYGSQYFVSGMMKNHMETFNEILSKVAPGASTTLAKADNPDGGSNGRHG